MIRSLPTQPVPADLPTPDGDATVHLQKKARAGRTRWPFLGLSVAILAAGLVLAVSAGSRPYDARQPGATTASTAPDRTGLPALTGRSVTTPAPGAYTA